MKLLAFVLAVMTTFIAFGSNDADTVKVYFRVGQSQFDPSLDNNREEMDKCLSMLKAYAESDIESIIVRAYTSPDGTSKTNELLARQRCDAISDYIVAKTGINRNLIRKIPEGIAWEGLRSLVEATPGVPDREAVLNILDNTPVWVFDSDGKIVGGRKSSLMSLRGGRPYNWMLRNLFPQLRNAVAIIVVTKGNAHSEETGNGMVEEVPVKMEPADGKGTTEEPEIPGVTEETGIPECFEEAIESEEISGPEEQVEYEYTEDRFALKTNLLYYAALMPNLELEWRCNLHWTVALEGDVAWWGGNVRKYRLAVVTPEVRYRLLMRDYWHGMYVGIFAGPGMYDLENRKNGYEGEGVLAGVSVGYSWPIAKRLSLEAGLGVGYMYTRYKEYMPLGGHFVYQQTKDLHYFGPLRLRLSLAWQFGHRRVVKTNNKTQQPVI